MNDNSLIKFFQFQTIVIAIEAAMDHKPSHREMTSVLISQLLMEGVLSSEDVAKGFEILLGNLPDLILDAPVSLWVSFIPGKMWLQMSMQSTLC